MDRSDKTEVSQVGAFRRNSDRALLGPPKAWRPRPGEWWFPGVQTYFVLDREDCCRTPRLTSTRYYNAKRCCNESPEI